MRSLLVILCTIFLTLNVALAKPKTLHSSKPLNATLIKIEGTTLLVAASSKGPEILVPTDEKTQFSLDGMSAKLADLMPGMKLLITQVEGLTRQVEANAVKEKK